MSPETLIFISLARPTSEGREGASPENELPSRLGRLKRAHLATVAGFGTGSECPPTPALES